MKQIVQIQQQASKKNKIWVLYGNRTHDFPYTGKSRGSSRRSRSYLLLVRMTRVFHTAISTIIYHHTRRLIHCWSQFPTYSSVVKSEWRAENEKLSVCETSGKWFSRFDWLLVLKLHCCCDRYDRLNVVSTWSQLSLNVFPSDCSDLSDHTETSLNFILH